ncbi:Immunoglobulin domain containing protein, partial [Euroglyphus maynei]
NGIFGATIDSNGGSNFNSKNHHRIRYYKKYQPYNVLIGESISLPCNITPSITIDDDVSLILWYRDDQSTPIYTVDARGLGNTLKTAKHFHDNNIFDGDDDVDDRITFNITYPISYLRFKQTRAHDTAEYRCRVDFRRDRTINRVMKLNVIGMFPANKLTIFDDNNNNINDIAGPFNEDEPLNLTCISEGGHPIPKVRWWKGEQLINDGDGDDDGDISVSNVIIDNNKSLIIVKNVIKFKKMLRKHLMMPITCESMNTNLTVPITKTILIDLNCKFKQ